MYVIRARNVHDALPKGLHLLHTVGVKRDSRNGPVLQIPEPVATVYSAPTERVLFHPWRDVNPFLHFYESLWMLAGRNDIKPLTYYVSRWTDFSDDGVTQNAAYGHRWRSALTRGQQSIHDAIFERDQLRVICDLLRQDKDTRQCVLQIWDHERDLGTKTKDHACNVAATFQVGCDGRLDTSVFCRSNDMIWGAYGANAVHFSMLHEYVARRSGHPIGKYTQISVNLHGYLSTAGALLEHHTPEDTCSPYDTHPLYEYPICDGLLDDTWDADCRTFVSRDGRLPETPHFKNTFFLDVAWPIVQAHQIYKDYAGPDRYEDALAALEKCQADDWRVACTEWITRRYEKWSKR